MFATKLDLLLWATSFIEQAVLLFILLWRRRYRSFPLFTGLILLNVARTMTLYGIRLSEARAAYFYTYWTLAPVDIALQLGIVYELTLKVFRPWGDWGLEQRKKLYSWAILSIVVAGILSLIPKPSSRFWMQGPILRLSFFSAALMSELLIGMIVLSAVAQRRWSNHAAVIAKGLAIYSVSSLILETLNTWMGLGGDGMFYQNLSRIRIAIYICCVAYWIAGLWRNVPAAEKMPSHIHQQAWTISRVMKQRIEALGRKEDS